MDVNRERAERAAQALDAAAAALAALRVECDQAKADCAEAKAALRASELRARIAEAALRRTTTGECNTAGPSGEDGCCAAIRGAPQSRGSYSTQHQATHACPLPPPTISDTSTPTHPYLPANTMSGAAATIVAAARTAGVATNDPEAMVAFALGFKAARTAAPASPPPLENRPWRRAFRPRRKGFIQMRLLLYLQMGGYCNNRQFPHTPSVVSKKP